MNNITIKMKFTVTLLAVCCRPLSALEQLPDWEYHTSRGNQALADNTLALAARHYEQALAMAAAFRPEDLRRPTSMRNLAHALAMTGVYARADSLYGRAIALGAELLPAGHQYLRTMTEEHDRLKEAMLRSSLLDLESPEPLTLYEKLVRIAENARNITTFQSGPLMAVTKPIFDSHNPTLAHILIIRRPIWTSGSLALTVNLSRVGVSLPADKNLFLPNFTFRGFGLGTGFRAGKWVIDAALGPHKVRTATGREIRPVITAGITRNLWDQSSGRNRSGYYLDLAVNFISVPTAPGASAGAIMMGAGIAIGYFHKSYD